MKNKGTTILQVGAIGSPLVSDGRLLPYLTIDCTSCPNVENFIEAHSDIELPGDVISTWCWNRFSKSHVYLRLDFERPIKTSTLLIFPTATLGYVVEWIMTVRGFYLQSSKYGSCASEGLESPCIVVEVPSNTTFPSWADIYRKRLIKRFKHAGYRGKSIDTAIENHMARQKETWFRHHPGSKTLNESSASV